MSSRETASGERPSTALATRWLMAATFCGARRAPGLILTSTLALAGCWASRNTESLGKVRWTRACLDFGQRHDGPLQFAFQRPPVVHVFGEFGGAEIHFVEQFEADAARLGQADGGHGKPQFGQPGGRHQHRAAALGQAVLGAGFLQFLHDTGGVFRRQARKERAKIAFLLPLHHRIQAGSHRNRHHQDGDALPCGEVRQNLAHDLEGA